MTFGAESTTDDVLEGVDLSGERVLVTGASAGLGQETARAVAAHGGDVIMGGARPREGQGRRRAGARRGGVDRRPRRAASGRPRLARRRCGRSPTTCSPTTTPIDVIIANAGVMACPEGRTADGFETQFGTNHLGHFVLVNRLAAAARRRSAGS